MIRTYRTMRKIVMRYRSGDDSHAILALDRRLHCFAKVIATINRVLDPDVIVVGGDEVKVFIDVAMKIADFFEVSLHYLTIRMSQEVDPDIVKRVTAIQSLPEKDRNHILFAIDAMLRDAKTRFAYATSLTAPSTNNDPARGLLHPGYAASVATRAEPPSVGHKKGLAASCIVPFRADLT